VSAPSTGRRVAVTLTDAQVAQVVLEAAGDIELAGSMSGLSSLEELRQVVLPFIDDETYSHAIFRGVMVLAAFPADGSERELTDVARTVGLSPSTTYRYARSWIALGLLEQNTRSRRYRRPPARRPDRAPDTTPAANEDA
jgi:hypothetical protein